MAKTIVGLYDEYNTAEKAVDALRESGIDRNNVHVNSHDDAHTSSRFDREDLREHLVREGVPEEEAEMYDEGMRRGGTVVIVETTDEAAEQVAEVLRMHRAVDLEERRTVWREEAQQTDREEAAGNGFASYADAFQEHYRTTYGGDEYGAYEPAYRFGHRYSTREEYGGREWEDIKPEVRRQYEAQHGEGTFEDVKEAIRHGFTYPRRARSERT